MLLQSFKEAPFFGIRQSVTYRFASIVVLGQICYGGKHSYRNGTVSASSLPQSKWYLTPLVHLHVVPSLSIMAGSPPHWQVTHITAKELVPVVIAASLWGRKNVCALDLTTWL